jgi:hypothetical protein
MPGRHFLWLITCCLLNSMATAQNAKSHFSNPSPGAARTLPGSFVIDSSVSGVGIKRGMLLWGRTTASNGSEIFALDEYGLTGGFISRRIGSCPPTQISPGDISKQKIIRSRFFSGYYLVGNIAHCSPVIIRLDINLNPVWSKYIYGIADGNTSVIFDNIIETANGDIVLVGRAGANLLVTRLNYDGIIKWCNSYENEYYYEILPSSLVETTGKRICITGTIRRDPAEQVDDELLFMVIESTGTPVLMKGVNGYGALDDNAGARAAKIVRVGDEAGNNRFLIAGTFLHGRFTNHDPRDYQVLITEIDERGMIRGAWTVIDIDYRNHYQQHEVNDLIFSQDGDDDYTLHLTGGTNSYEARIYYLRLRYTAGTMRLLEFKTSSHSAYPNVGDGLEIKKAGLSKIAILANIVAGYEERIEPSYFSASVIIRDQDDKTDDCFESHYPPVNPIDLRTTQYIFRPTARNLVTGNYKFVKGGTGYSTPLCGRFEVDPYQANTDTFNPGELTKKAIYLTVLGMVQVYAF